MIKKNDDIELEITDISNEGSGVALVDGFVIFIFGAVTGDKILAHIIKVKSSYAVGIIHKILIPSPYRICVDCLAFPRCGGCRYRHIDYKYELEIKKKQIIDAFKHIGKIDLPLFDIVTSPLINRYRNKGMYPVGQGNDRINIGFYAPKSHRIINNRDCLLSPIEFKKAIDLVEKWMMKFSISAYDEESGNGLIRHIYLRQSHANSKIMLCIVINARKLPFSNQLIELCKNELSSISGIIVNYNTDDTNVVLGNKYDVIYGSGYITDEICGLKFKISPLSFFQVNTEGADVLYKIAKDYANVQNDEVLLDLYCGTGTIGLTMAKDCKKLVGIEIVQSAIENAKENAKANGIENAEFYCSDSSNMHKILQSNKITPDCIVVDPPRKGLSKDVIESILQFNPQRIVYVSCNAATLARDAKILAENGYDVKKVSAVNMFPRTIHCETVALLSKL